MRSMLCAAGVLCVGATIAQADVVYSDGTFTPSTWGFETVIVGSGSSAASQSNTGNPGFARRLDNSVGGFSTVWGLSRFGTNQATRYEPVNQGAILSVDFAIDHRFVSGSAEDGQIIRLGAKQGSFVYAAGFAMTGTSDAWGSTSFLGMTAADFVALNGGGPINFSATADPIRFGFVVGNTASGANGATAIVDYDNFLVRVVPVPAPGAAGCLLGGLGMMGVLARRRR